MTNYSLKPTDENALGLLKTDPMQFGSLNVSSITLMMSGSPLYFL